MRRERVTIWNSVPAMLSMLADYEGRRTDAAPALRLVFTGGDRIPIDLPDRIRALRPETQVVSVGGPTETTLWNIWHPIGAVEPEWKSIPYGRPIPNTKYYILNHALEDCPVWVAGEICSSGAGTALGYYNNPERTAEKFVKHPVTGERLYRSGDCGRYLPDGTIEFLGRVDFQVSLNGHRIEPAEIEAALLGHSAVKEAAVAAFGEGAGKRLVAYVVAVGERPTAGDLRHFAEAKLPPHMVPRSYVFLDRLPLTSTGKVDRKALPPPASGAGEREPAAAVTELDAELDTELERRLVAWNGSVRAQTSST
jgi:acyl-coenzyme A synthetase/AMP-(fatty) acid ligase